MIWLRSNIDGRVQTLAAWSREYGADYGKFRINYHDGRLSAFRTVGSRELQAHRKRPRAVPASDSRIIPTAE